VDATRTVELLESLKKHPGLAGVRLSPLTITALAVCDAARNFPGINSSFDSEAHEVIVRRSVNLGIAASTDRGLIVPNIKGADQLDLVAMASALNLLVEKARAGTTCRPAPAPSSLLARSQRLRGSSTTKSWCATLSNSPCPSITGRLTARWRRRCWRTWDGSSRIRRPRSSLAS
jgi:hypothetical protein